jgi:AP endonuclease-1
MSIKRKTDDKETVGVTKKKPKFDFFAPKTAVAKTGPLFNFSSKDTNATRLTAWNVNGIHSILKDEQKRKVSKSLTSTTG